ncbi:ATP-binding protein, partial [Candidatus Peregrinibacteria bacterium]|nr:ATP-binding protein [Candidatus Peregrinibacteria bacterium]
MERLRTEWVLIDGAPSSGKTTVIQALHRRGYRIIPEVGRAYVELELARGRTLDEIRGNEEHFQHALIALYAEQFQRLNPQQSVILDGGFPHAQAYIELNRTPHM